VLYQGNKNYDLDEIKKSLKMIYEIRSCIAHGNLTDLNVIIKKEKDKGNKYYLESIVSTLYSYLRIIVIEYLNDPKFIEHLKSS